MSTRRGELDSTQILAYKKVGLLSSVAMLSQWQVKFPVSDNHVLQRWSVSSLALDSKVSESEQIRLRRSASCKEHCSSVSGGTLWVGDTGVYLGFVYRSTDIVSPTRLDLVSRNTCAWLQFQP